MLDDLSKLVESSDKKAELATLLGKYEAAKKQGNEEAGTGA